MVTGKGRRVERDLNGCSIPFLYTATVLRRSSTSTCFIYPRNISPILNLHPKMIRRNPTLIPMSDSDVQDVRDMVAKQRVEDANLQRGLLKLRQASERTLSDDEIQMVMQMKDAHQEKERRLGIQ